MALGLAVRLHAVVTVLRATAALGEDLRLRARADALGWEIRQAIDLIAGTKF